MSTTTHLTTTYKGPRCTLTLVPPEGKPPTLDHAVMEAFERTLGEIEDRLAEVAVVVIESASPKYFCAGANLSVMRTIDAESIVPWVTRGHGLMNRLEALPVPVVARVEGYALGGGLELAMACDLIFAAAGARLGQPEAKLGLVTGWGGCYRLARRVGVARAKELVFSGRLLEAEEAYRLGLCEWQGAALELERQLDEFVTATAANGRTAVREMKRILNTVPGHTLAEIAAEEIAASQRCLGDPDTAERLAQFFRKRSS